MGFEVFDRGRRAPSKAPTFAVQKRGILSFNDASHKLIGEAQFVELLFDPDDRVIALRPSEETPRTYMVRAPEKSPGVRVVSATSFVQHYDIDVSVSRRYVPTVQDGMLCVALNADDPAAPNEMPDETPDETPNETPGGGDGH